MNIAGQLRRRRLLLAVGLLLAVTFGAWVGGVLPSHNASATPPAGEALVQVMVDTRVPLVATTARGTADTIAQRSVLLAAFMASDAMTKRIAEKMGIRPSALSVIGPVLLPVSEFSLVPNGQLAQVAATAAQSAVHTPYVVRLQPNYTVPVVSIGTAAPDVRDAVALAQATLATLKSAILPTATVAPTSLHPAANGAAGKRPSARTARRPQPVLGVESLGAPRSVAVAASGLHLLRGVGASLGLLAAWCAGIVIAVGLGRLWKRTGSATAISAGSEIGY